MELNAVIRFPQSRLGVTLTWKENMEGIDKPFTTCLQASIYLLPEYSYAIPTICMWLAHQGATANLSSSESGNGMRQSQALEPAAQ